MATTKSPTGQMSLLEHLIELRTRLIRCAIAVAVGAVLGWLIYQPFLDFMSRPLEDLTGNPNVRATFLSFEPMEQFMLRIKISGYLGIVITLPFLLSQVWGFVAPGLYQNEKRYASAFIVSATVLFLLGAGIAYYTLPEALKFLQSVGGNDVVYQYTTKSYLELIVFMMVAFGVGFQFPILLLFLQLVGLVTPQALAGFRRFAIVIVFIIAAVITPSADPISLCALAVPMVIFYEISILIGRVVLGRRLRREASA